MAVTEQPTTLAAAATLLLGAAAPAMAGPVVTAQGEIQQLHYSEADGRMQVKDSAASLKLPLQSDAELDLTLGVESLSGASPQFVTNENGISAEVLSTPSITEFRRELELNYRHYLEAMTLSVGVGHSSENDYRSRSVNSSISFPFNQNNSEFTIGAGHSSDTISATNNPTLNDKRSTNQLFAGLTQTLSPTTIVQSNLGYSHGHGYYSDPYKFTLLFDPEAELPIPSVIQDQRPRKRESWSWLTQANHYTSRFSGRLSGQYRYYKDDWGIRAHTFDLSWHHDPEGPWSTQYTLRYYSQRHAAFYYGDRLPTTFSAELPFSTDHRLAGFGAITPGVRITRKLDQDLKLSIDLQHYRQSNALKLGGRGNQLNSLEASIVALSLKKEF